MDEKTLVDKLSNLETIDQLVDLAKQIGKPLSYNDADQLFGKINQCKNDVAELGGDTIAKLAKQAFGI
ncbi:hypothetical protein [Bifidobacterium asteroides]|uniref:hypothetical protein n=1 Tax=Bifidobacterium asteroides TaxID=1684 RepID=UPI0020C2908C|nr:hypothetical protein [Bifidobacterium asteroides]MCP8613653.1 hypothetical protein [Bifidobacterium asteroides]